MHSSDSPIDHESPKLLRGAQGPSDWKREPRSDDLLSDEAKERLKRAWEEWQAEHSPDS